MFAMQACNRQAFVCVPLYDSLGEDAVEFEVREVPVEDCVVGPTGAWGRRVWVLNRWGDGLWPTGVKSSI